MPYSAGSCVRRGGDKAVGPPGRIELGSSGISSGAIQPKKLPQNPYFPGLPRSILAYNRIGCWCARYLGGLGYVTDSRPLDGNM